VQDTRSLDVDPQVDDGSPAAQSRTYAVAAQQIFDNPLGLLPTCSYNAELVVPLSAAMRRSLARSDHEDGDARRLSARRPSRHP
jgi:hypothetical protein